MIKLCCVGCAGTHTLPEKSPIVFHCAVCGIINTYDDCVLDHMETWEHFTRLTIYTNESDLRAYIAYAFGAVATVHKGNIDSYWLHHGSGTININQLPQLIPHEEEHALWRHRLTA